MELRLTPKFENFIKNKKFNETKLTKMLSKYTYDDMPDMIYIWSVYGTGKTFAVQNFLNNAPENIGRYYTTLSNLILDLQSFEQFSEKVERVYQYKEHIKILVIDEIDKMKLTEWKEEMIFNIIDGRISNEYKTILTSNSNVKDLSHKLGENIVSRILTDAVIVEYKGEVLR